MYRLLFALVLTLPCLGQAVVTGRVTDGRTPLDGVRVFPDRLARPLQAAGLMTTRTGSDGAFRLPVLSTDTAVVVEKEGYYRDIAPLGALNQDIVLRPIPCFRRDRVLVVRVNLPDSPMQHSNDVLRSLFYGRAPGAASVASYLYEVSKGALLLEEGAFMTLDLPVTEPGEAGRKAITEAVLRALQTQDMKAFDWVDNRTGALGADGVPDHLWIVAPGPTSVVTGDEAHLPTESRLVPLPDEPERRWGVVFFTEETPLGFLVHELLHAQGEHRVDDLYMDGRADTAGGWDLMDAGMMRGWDRQHPEAGPWLQDMAYSPAHPMAWTRAELWYHGAFRASVPVLEVKTKTWEGWIDPLVRAPGVNPQALRVGDPRRKGAFWELSLRRPLGFDRGRVGNRWGAGYEGLVVAHIDPSKLSTDGASKGPVRVVDAHPGTKEPPKPRFPGKRWQLEDAAFQLGKGEIPAGQDGPLRWRVLEVDAAGRMKLRLALR